MPGPVQIEGIDVRSGFDLGPLDNEIDIGQHTITEMHKQRIVNVHQLNDELSIRPELIGVML